jgi:hypothetical protein
VSEADGKKEKSRRDGAGKPLASPRKLTPEAERALAEAAERRKAREGAGPPRKEIDGRDGPDPTRYGDWEVKGIASDF